MSKHAALQAKEIAKYQLELWGLDYFDLYLIHFPISLEDVDIKAKYPPEWWGLDGGVHPSEYRPSYLLGISCSYSRSQRPHP